MANISGRKMGTRRLGTALLLVLLAASGYTAAGEAHVQAVAVPVIRNTLTAQEISAVQAADVRVRLREARENEIALLDGVLADPDAGGEIRRSALEQKTALAHRMEQEACIEAALSWMGVQGGTAVCGAETVTVFVPAEMALNESGRVRIIDAAASQTGISPGDVKIILAKK